MRMPRWSRSANAPDNAGHQVLYIGSERGSNKTRPYAGFRLAKVKNAGSSGSNAFSGQHVDGDLLIVSDYSTAAAPRTCRLPLPGKGATGSPALQVFVQCLDLQWTPSATTMPAPSPTAAINTASISDLVEQHDPACGRLLRGRSRHHNADRHRGLSCPPGPEAASVYLRSITGQTKKTATLKGYMAPLNVAPDSSQVFRRRLPRRRTPEVRRQAAIGSKRSTTT